MLPKLYKRRNSTNSDSPNTPIFYQASSIASDSFHSKQSSIHYEENRPRLISDLCKDAVEIKKLNSLISKLKQDNKLLKSFILSTNITRFASNDKGKNSSSLISKEFEKLENYLK